MQFTWEIEEASDVDMSVCNGAEVRLDDLKIVVVNGWAVEEPDRTVILVPVQGGTVENVDLSGEPDSASKAAQSMSSLNLGVGFTQTVIIIIIALLGLGFLLTLVNDVRLGRLEFGHYISIVFSLLAGFGVGKFSQYQKND